MRTLLPEEERSNDLAACAAMLRGGSRTFFAASHLLPRKVSEPAAALYAFCRLADDAVDLEQSKSVAVARLRERLERAYCGKPFPTAADRAFADVVACFAIPRELPEALLEGLSWDAEGRCYEDLSALTSYAVRVAGTVGVMMALLMGARRPQILARACDLGVAMQLTNIARDVGEDAAQGRLYLPRQWLRDAGICPDDWLTKPIFSQQLGAIVRRLLEEADSLYARSRSGIARLPIACRPGIHAARLIYAEIGREIERRGGDSVAQRAVVSRRRKLGLLAQSVAAVALGGARGDAPALPEAQYLVDAVSAASIPLAQPQSPANPLAAIEKRAVWVIDLFADLEQRAPRVPGAA
jgi:15-cis-phytoene synthase